MLLLAHRTKALNISFTLPCRHWISLATLQSWSPRSNSPSLTEEADIDGDFLGVEVETCDLLGIEEEPGQPSSSTLPDDVQGAAKGAPLETGGGNEASASAEPDTTTGDVAVGSSPSAPSRPPRTGGARGGKDKIYKDYRRVFYQGFEQLKAFLAEHLSSRPGRSNFVLQKIDFELSPSRLQELLINWSYFRGSASIQQILCEAEYLIGQVARHVGQHGYSGEGYKLAQHIREKTPTIESLYTDDPSEQRTYSEAWDSRHQDPVQEPIRRRVGAKSKAAGDVVAKGAASSAPDRSTSVGSGVGRKLLPPPKKGKGSSKGEESSTTSSQWKPSLRGSSPAVLPLTPIKLDLLPKLDHRSHHHPRFVCQSNLCIPLLKRGPQHQSHSRGDIRFQSGP